MTDAIELYQLTLGLALALVCMLDAWLIGRTRKPPCD